MSEFERTPETFQDDNGRDFKVGLTIKLSEYGKHALEDLLNVEIPDEVTVTATVRSINLEEKTLMVRFNNLVDIGRINNRNLNFMTAALSSYDPKCFTVVEDQPLKKQKKPESYPVILKDVNGREFKAGSNVRLSELGRENIKPSKNNLNLRGRVTSINYKDGSLVIAIDDFPLNFPREFKKEYFIVE
jgi:hypothetical protein